MGCRGIKTPIMALKKQLKKALKKNSPITIAALVELLDTNEEAVRGVVSKNSKKFAINADEVSLIGDITPSTSPNASPVPEKRKAEEIISPATNEEESFPKVS